MDMISAGGHYVALITEVAALAGVSIATVSRALNGTGPVSENARAKVLKAASDLGYVVSSSAASLVTGRMKNIGIVVPFLSRWFFGTVIEGAEAALQEHGYDLTLYNLGGGVEARRRIFEHSLLRRRVDAVIAVGLELRPEELARLHDVRKPIVGVGGPLPGIPTVSIDDFEVGRMATDHLLKLGHTAIGIISGDAESETDFHVPTDRRKGYEAALGSAGIPVENTLFAVGNFTIEGGYAAAMILLQAPLRPTAIFAASDEMAFGVQLAAKDLGLDIPRDISVIGVDGHHLSPFFELTTVAQFPERQGKRAVELLMREIAPHTDEIEPIAARMPHELIVRSSTAPPRAQ